MRLLEMEMTVEFWVSVAVGVVSLLWRWNDFWYALPFLLRRGGGGGGKLPPGYMGLPFIGETLAFLWYFKVLRRPDDFINAKRRKYGDGVGMYRTHLFGEPTIIVYTPSANKFVLQSESNFAIKWNSEELVGKSSLVTKEGDAHSRVRGVVVRDINQPDALRKIALMVQPRVVASLESWCKRGRIKVFKVAKKLVFANTGKYFAGFEKESVLETLDDLFVGVANGIRASPLNFPGTAHHYALQKATAIFREELEKRKKCEEASQPKNDLMEALMHMEDEEGNRLTDDEVLDNSVSLVIGGYTSTSLAVTWALYCLAKYPDVMLKLREEHMPISKKLKGEFVTYEEITSCKYTNKVIEETIRMANVAAFLFRTARKDVEYQGYKIPKGWKVACWLRYLHTNPELFDDPMSFNPERWNNAPKAGSFLVFGGGPRICAGNMYARLQIGIIIHHLVVGYKWKLVNPNAEMSYLPHPKPANEVEIHLTAI